MTIHLRYYLHVIFKHVLSPTQIFQWLKHEFIIDLDANRTENPQVMYEVLKSDKILKYVNTHTSFTVFSQ